MTDMQLTFDTVVEADTAVSTIGVNVGYPVISCNAQTHDFDAATQQTIDWAFVAKADEINLWYFKVPPEEYMENVVNYTKQPYDPSWGNPATP